MKTLIEKPMLESRFENPEIQKRISKFSLIQRSRAKYGNKNISSYWSPKTIHPLQSKKLDSAMSTYLQKYVFIVSI